jgi:hypothetical protein
MKVGDLVTLRYSDKLGFILGFRKFNDENDAEIFDVSTGHNPYIVSVFWSHGSVGTSLHTSLVMVNEAG